MKSGGQTSDKDPTKAGHPPAGRLSLQLRQDLSAMLSARRKGALSEARNATAHVASDLHESCSHNDWEREVLRGGGAESQHLFRGTYELRVSIFVSENHDNQQASSQQVICISEQFTHLGTRVWDCAVLMVKYFEHMAESSAASNGASLPFPRGARVLELGAGSGLLGIALAKSYGVAVVATEYGKTLVNHLQRNCRLNNVLLETNSSSSFEDAAWTNACTHHAIAGQVACYELDWYSFLETKNHDNHHPHHDDHVAALDYIVVSDCSLTPREAMSVLQVIYHLASPTTQVFVGCCRQRDGTATFVQACPSYFHHVEQCVDFHPEFTSPRQLLLRLRQKREKLEQRWSPRSGD